MSKLVLYWEVGEKLTTTMSCQLDALVDSAASHPRVSSFLHGDPAKGYSPIDLRMVTGKEPTIVTDALESAFLYVIDGNHRMVSQYCSQTGFQDVGAFVCVHPDVKKWAYIPNYHKKLLASGN